MLCSVRLLQFLVRKRNTWLHLQGYEERKCKSREGGKFFFSDLVELSAFFAVRHVCFLTCLRVDCLDCSLLKAIFSIYNNHKLKILLSNAFLWYRQQDGYLSTENTKYDVCFNFLQLKLLNLIRLITVKSFALATVYEISLSYLAI